MPFIGQSLPDSKSLTFRAQSPRTLRLAGTEYLSCWFGFAKVMGAAECSATPTQSSRAALALPRGLRHAGHLGHPFLSTPFHFRRCNVFGMRSQIPVMSLRVDHFAEAI